MKSNVQMGHAIRRTREAEQLILPHLLGALDDESRKMRVIGFILIAYDREPKPSKGWFCRVERSDSWTDASSKDRNIFLSR